MDANPVFRDALQGPRAWLVAAIILLFPATTLVLEGAASFLLLLLALLGIVFALRERGEPLSRDEKLLVFSVAFFVGIAVLSYLLGELNYLGFKKLGRYARFLLLIPIYLVVRRMPHSGRYWWTGLAIGGIAVGLFSLLLLIDEGRWIEGNDLFNLTTEPLLFASLSLVVAFMSLGGVEYFRGRSAWLMLLPAAGFVLGCTATFLSGVRSSWVAVPGLALFLFWYFATRRAPAWRWGVLGGLLAVAVLVYLVPQTGVAERVHMLVEDVGRILAGEKVEGVIGYRVPMAKIAWHAFLQNPLFGAGVGGYAVYLREFVEAGLAPEQLLRFDHPHSEYLAVLAGRGLAGLLALLLVFGIPLRHFLWGIRHPDRDIAALSYAGIALVVGFMQFALTEAIFDRTLPITFYVFCLAVIYGLVRACEREYLSRSTQRAQSLSVIIIAKNEADRIGQTLAAIHGWADEIIVLDSGSSDETVEIARRYADKVQVTDWPGFGRQKQRALDAASCDWVLALDADEVVTPALRNEIDHELTAAPRFQGYRIPRPLIIFGQHVDYGGSWQAPLRLFRRTLARYTDVPVHEKVVLSEGKITLMRSGLHHPTYRDYQHALQKFVDYAWLQAGARWNRGRRSSMTGAALRAAYNFIYNYFIRFGFLDGAHGFVLAALHAQYTFNKYAALWAMEQEPHTAPPPGGE